MLIALYFEHNVVHGPRMKKYTHTRNVLSNEPNVNQSTANSDKRAVWQRISNAKTMSTQRSECFFLFFFAILLYCAEAPIIAKRSRKRGVRLDKNEMQHQAKDAPAISGFSLAMSSGSNTHAHALAK